MSVKISDAQKDWLLKKIMSEIYDDFGFDTAVFMVLAYPLMDLAATDNSDWFVDKLEYVADKIFNIKRFYNVCWDYAEVSIQDKEFMEDLGDFTDLPNFSFRSYEEIVKSFGRTALSILDCKPNKFNLFMSCYDLSLKDMAVEYFKKEIDDAVEEFSIDTECLNIYGIAVMIKTFVDDSIRRVVEWNEDVKKLIKNNEVKE